MNPWSLRCSKLAFRVRQIKFLSFLQILIQGVHGQGKSQREIIFFKAKELSGIFDISQGIFQFKPKSGNFEPEDQWSCKRSPESAAYTNKHV